MLGHLGAYVWPCWVYLVPSWDHVGPKLGHLGSYLGPSWSYVGAMLGQGVPPEVVMLFFSTSRKHRKLRGVGGSAAGAVLRVPNSTARSTGACWPDLRGWRPTAGCKDMFLWCFCDACETAKHHLISCPKRSKRNSKKCLTSLLDPCENLDMSVSPY